MAVQEALEEDVDVAVDAARAAYQYGSEWRMMSTAGRGQLLMKLADLIDADLEQISLIESNDNGKPMMLARGDVGAAAACFRYYAGWSDKIVGQTVDTGESIFPPAITATNQFRSLTIWLHKARAHRCLWTNHSVELPYLDVRLENSAGDCLR